MIDAYKDFWKRYLKFSGTSTRSQYWWVTLSNLIIQLNLIFPVMVLSMIYGDTSTIVRIFDSLSNLFAVSIFIPSVALVFRRLRDAGYRPHWIFIQLIPIVGPFVMFVLLCKSSKESI